MSIIDSAAVLLGVLVLCATGSVRWNIQAPAPLHTFNTCKAKQPGNSGKQHHMSHQHLSVNIFTSFLIKYSWRIAWLLLSVRFWHSSVLWQCLVWHCATWGRMSEPQLLKRRAVRRHRGHRRFEDDDRSLSAHMKNPLIGLRIFL